MRLRLLLAVLFVGSWFALVGEARAQDVAAAQALFQQGVTFADAERWGEAAECFRQARAIVERPSIVCNLGFALHHLGAATDARSALTRCRELAELDPTWRSANRPIVDRAARLLREMRPAIARLTLVLDPQTTEVFVDGEPVEGPAAPTRVIELDPGRHRLVLSAPGYATLNEEIAVLSGAEEERRYELVLLPARPATLVVDAPEDAVVSVDRDEIGRGHVEHQLAAGTYELFVRAPGRALFQRTLTLAEGERLIVDATSSDAQPVTASPWFWIAVGGGVVLATVGIILAVLSAPEKDPLAAYNGSTGVVLQPLIEF